MIAIRITPTKVEGSCFLHEQVKKDGVWKNKGSAVPAYINGDTTVFELMGLLTGNTGDKK